MPELNIEKVFLLCRENSLSLVRSLAILSLRQMGYQLLRLVGICGA